MAEAPKGLDIMILKPTNFEEIIAKSQNTREPYTWDDLERMYRKGLNANSAVFISFITHELWDD